MGHYTIIGFGNAGFHAAKAIREKDRQAEIHVYSDNDQPPTNPMLTTYCAKGVLPYDAIFPYGSLEDIIREYGITFHAHKKVTRIMPETKELLFEDGLIEPYQKALIATGASAFRPNVEGMDLPGVFVMRTPEDAVSLKETLKSCNISSILVVGASMVGVKIVELAESHSIRCTLIDGAAYMFPLAAFSNVAERIQETLCQKGIQLGFSALFSKIEEAGDGDRVKGHLVATMSDGRTYQADVVVVCIGTRTNTALIQGTDIAVNRGILVDRKMCTNIPDLYAAGDCCAGYELQYKEQRVIGLWANAGYQGRAAGINMAGGNREFDFTILHNISHFMGMDFLGFGDATSIQPEDEVYEYESPHIYLKAIKGFDGKVKCINMLGGASVSGIIRDLFMKSMTESQPLLNEQLRCILDSHVPNDFIIFLGGVKHD